MRLVFLCGSLEPGRDGVGDYTRKLAGGLIAQGHSASVIAINDKYIQETDAALQHDHGKGVEVLRIPASMDWKAKALLAETYIKKNNPDWISLQYVSYAYQPKGMPLHMVQAFAGLLGKYRLQIMFHELWLGEKKNAALKARIYGFLQKKIVRSMLKKGKPQVIQTSIPLYQKILSNHGIKAGVLPIFSNISDLKLPYDTYAGEIPEWLVKDREDFVIGCNFGSFYQESWDLTSLLVPFAAACKKIGKRPLIYSIGKISAGEKEWKELAAVYPEITFLTVGACSQEMISYWLTYFTDFGIITTPAFIAGKSGSFMAFKAHGLYCFCKENDLEFDFGVQEIGFDKSLILIRSEADFYIPKRNSTTNQLDDTMKLFINSLNSSK
ncbi:glycosyltransferase [Pedobacter hartonius]|uniref:Uncharacterized protein n=1 Tax=Pedobacter hartonius TaxID=425514 RepID=A0A1H4FPU7_9SPHI|nr:glycosyltransferase [Pedobacter hartonius]SEA98860.1 hypothetical protein SAMN05443550_10831 [Pedobacter hartonius]